MKSPKIYTPDDYLDFGKNKGLKLSIVYKFQPSYIEWAIENIPEFVIDIQAFESLPKPTPGFYNDKTFQDDKSKYDLKNPTNEMLDELMEKSTINSLKSINAYTLMDVEFECIDYSFPERIKQINEGKHVK